MNNLLKSTTPVLGAFISFGCLLLLPLNLLGQQSDPLPIDFRYNYATFKSQSADELTSDVVVSYEFRQRGLTFRDSLGSLLVTAKVLDPSGTLLNTFVSQSIVRQNEKAKSETYVMNAMTLNLPAGQYMIRLGIADKWNLARRDSVEFALNVPDYHVNEPTLSDIEFVTEMAPRMDANDPFVRGDYVLLRNIRAEYIYPDCSIVTYVELDNLKNIPTEEFLLSWFVADTAGNRIYRRDTILARKGQDHMILTNSLSCENLGSHQFVVAARLYFGMPGIATDSFQVLRTFYVYNDYVDSILAAGESNVSTTFGTIDPVYMGMTEEELDEEFREASFIVTTHGQQVWKQLSGPEPKGRFLTNFWKALDEDPESPENKFKEDYEARLSYAAKMYRSGKHPDGWSSDRGRILLTYGKPDQIDRHPNEQNRKPFEIWKYTGLNYEFVFVERNSTSAYELVHATAPNEIRTPDWEREYAVVHDYQDGERFDSDY